MAQPAHNPSTTSTKEETTVGRDAEEWALSARIANAERWAKATPEDRARNAQMLNEARRAKWTREIDPGGKLPPDELARRLAHKEKSHMLRMQKIRLRRRAGKLPKDAA
jgi:hypothetical protein